MAYTTITNLRGPEGPEGPQGLPGAEGVPTDSAVSILLGIPSDTRVALLAQLSEWRKTGTFNILDYGASSNPAVDSTPGIQAAIDAAHAAGGGTVLVPKGGSYLTNSRIVMRSGVTLSAYGATLIHGPDPFAWVRNWYADVEYPDGYNGHGDFTIEGGTWLGNAATLPSGQGSGNAFQVAHADGVLIRDLSIVDACSAAHAVEINSSRNVLVDNVRALGYTRNGSTTESEAFQVDGAFGAYSNAPGLADDTTCQSVTFRDCYVGPSAALGSYPRGFGNHSIAPGKFHDHIKVVECRVDGALDLGIRAYAWRDSLVSGCTVAGSLKGGIQVRVGIPGNEAGGSDPVPGVTVIGNHVIDPGDYGIGVVGETAARTYEPIIANNHVRNAVGQGISVSYSRGASVLGNTIVGSGSHAIAVADSTDLLVESNRVQGAGGYGVILSPNVLGSRVQGNHVVGAATGAFRFSIGSMDCALHGNTARLGGVAAGVGRALSITAACERIWYFGNDFAGFGETGVADSGIASVTSAGNRT